MNLITLCALLPIIVWGGNSESDIRVQYDSYSYQDSSYDTYTITEYLISNDSYKMSYITFICPYYEGCDIEKTIMRYFYSSHKDFNLMTLLTDNVVLQGSTPIIGKTFLQEISPKGVFGYKVVELSKKHDASNSDMCIFVVDRKHLENMLEVNLTDDLFFKKDEIVIFQ